MPFTQDMVFCQKMHEFSEMCRDHGIKFIGASPEMIEGMGDKSNAKATMIAAGVPCVPGSEGLVKRCKRWLKNGQRNRISCHAKSYRWWWW